MHAAAWQPKLLHSDTDAPLASSQLRPPPQGCGAPEHAMLRWGGDGAFVWMMSMMGDGWMLAAMGMGDRHSGSEA